MALAMFDLDNTLIAGDSDYLWGRFLALIGAVDAITYEQANLRFYQQYREGCLDINAFLRFTLQPLSEHPLPQLLAWRQQFMATYIEPIILPAGLELINQHRLFGDTLLIVTATNSFVTSPIAARCGISNLLATELVMHKGLYTGQVDGIPCFQEGKVMRLEAWLHTNTMSRHGSWFYSDSHNDLPLLNWVEHPVVVDPDATLRDHALKHGWPIISLRSEDTACLQHG